MAILLLLCIAAHTAHERSASGLLIYRVRIPTPLYTRRVSSTLVLVYA